MNECTEDKRTLTHVVKAGAALALDVLKLAVVIEGKVGGRSPDKPYVGLPSAGDTRPVAMNLANVAEQAGNALSAALSTLERVNRSL